MKASAKKLSGILFALLLALSFTAIGCDDYSDTTDTVFDPYEGGDSSGGGGIGEGC